jgi:hypothetical protein
MRAARDRIFKQNLLDCSILLDCKVLYTAFYDTQFFAKCKILAKKPSPKTEKFLRAGQKTSFLFLYFYIL